MAPAEIIRVLLIAQFFLHSDTTLHSTNSCNESWKGSFGSYQWRDLCTCNSPVRLYSNHSLQLIATISICHLGCLSCSMIIHVYLFYHRQVNTSEWIDGLGLRDVHYPIHNRIADIYWHWLCIEWDFSVALLESNSYTMPVNLRVFQIQCILVWARKSNETIWITPSEQKILKKKHIENHTSCSLVGRIVSTSIRSLWFVFKTSS